MSAASITIGSPVGGLLLRSARAACDTSSVASSGTHGLDPALADTDPARCLDNGSPGVIGQWHPFAEALLARMLLGLAGDQHLAAGKGGFGAFEVGDVAR